MKKSVKAYLLTRFKNIKWDEYGPDVEADPLTHWPDIKACVESSYYRHPEIQQHCHTGRKPAKFECTERFLKSLERYCTTKSLRLRLIDALTKKIYGVACSGLRDAPIKERNDLWHFYVSASWRVFYRKSNDGLVFEEFCPHKKVPYYRRPRASH